MWHRILQIKTFDYNFWWMWCRYLDAGSNCLLSIQIKPTRWKRRKTIQGREVKGEGNGKIVGPTVLIMCNGSGQIWNSNNFVGNAILYPINKAEGDRCDITLSIICVIRPLALKGVKFQILFKLLQLMWPYGYSICSIIGQLTTSKICQIVFKFAK